MELHSSRIHRNLDAKLKIAGLEAPDLLFVLIFAAIMNLFFGETSLAIPLVLVLPSILLLILYFGKRNKPESFLVHLLRFYLTPGFLSAGESPLKEEKMRRHIYE
ncbi:MAG: hypothetical protein H6621_00075 [Halobacteriovoraceae bacterium]|nr:hypothetical protein [Halobacteriovoraceae bacterium]MCB9093436.1 hypothetical protein [Halobacteriovoraceae bacterium]